MQRWLQDQLLSIMPSPNISHHACRRWCITLNNYTDQEYEKFKTYCEAEADYAVIGKEKGDSQTPHLQCFICFKQKIRITTLKSKLSTRAHYESARGTVAQASVYCKKQNDFWEHGEPPRYGSGSRTTLVDASIDFIQSQESRSGSFKDFMQTHPSAWLLHGRDFVNNYMLTVKEIPRPNVFVVWIYGVTGVGKSHYANTRWPNAYRKTPNIKWWHRYQLEEKVIIDEMGPGCVDLSYWLTWLDKWPVTVETKGGDIPLHADSFIITSNYPPEYIFTTNTAALLRRVKVFEITDRDQFKQIDMYLDLQDQLRSIRNPMEGVETPDLSVSDFIDVDTEIINLDDVELELSTLDR